jgi:hypothetical protein
VLRRVGIGLAAAGVVMFVIGFLWLATTGGSSCSGDDCFRNAYAAAGFGQLGFALLFVIAGILNPNDRATTLVTATGLAVIAIPFLFVARRAAQRDRLHDTGIAATARILGLTQTGTWVNNNPMVRLDLEVTVPGHPLYEVQHAEVVPQILLGRLTDGSPLHLKVDPHHPSRYVIDWERW